MAFQLSNCLGLVTPNPGEAALFYASFFAMDLEDSPVTELLAGPFQIFVDPGTQRPIAFELVTDDLEQARSDARNLGFEELIWRGHNQSCLVRDPFGLIWSVHEDRTAFEPHIVDYPNHGIVRSCLGAQMVDAKGSAEFFSQVLDIPFSRIPGRSFLLDSGELRLIIQDGAKNEPLLFIRPDADRKSLKAAGCREVQEGLLVDPFGVHWRFETTPVALMAAVSPL